MARTFQVVYAMTHNPVEPAISIAIDISHTFSEVQHSLRYYMNGHVAIIKPELADERDLRENFLEACIKQKVKEISVYMAPMPRGILIQSARSGHPKSKRPRHCEQRQFQALT